MLNNTQIYIGFNAGFGIKHWPAKHFALPKSQRETSSLWFDGVEF